MFGSQHKAAMTDHDARSCSGGRAAFAEMLRAEYAHLGQSGDADASHSSYPAVAAAATSGDLGFCTGPWSAVASDGVPSHGHFLSVWQRDAECNWQPAHQARVTHAAAAALELKLSADNVVMPLDAAPPSKFIAADAMDQAVDDFQRTAIEDGFPSGLRTFARNNDFGFFTDGELPMTLDGANEYLEHHLFRGEWQESARAKSRDSTILYSVGALADARHHGSYSYVQIWQFDPKVVNWGLRFLLLGNS